jgi:hypothetical protein
MKVIHNRHSKLFGFSPKKQHKTKRKQTSPKFLLRVGEKQLKIKGKKIFIAFVCDRFFSSIFHFSRQLLSLSLRQTGVNSLAERIRQIIGMLMMHNFAIELARFYALSGRVYENAKDLKAQQQLLIQQQSISSVY